MNIERLTHLITVLERVPPGHLKMGNWACGTAACAVGWAAKDPVFNEQGFVLKGRRSIAPVFVLDATPGAYNPDNWDAVQLFFEIEFEDAWCLFGTNAYPADAEPAPADVIKRIRELLAREVTA
jgi:hypothetical protein